MSEICWSLLQSSDKLSISFMIRRTFSSFAGEIIKHNRKILIKSQRIVIKQRVYLIARICALITLMIVSLRLQSSDK